MANSYKIRITNQGSSSKYGIIDQKEIIIGRNVDANGIRVDNQSVSGKHLKLLFSDSGIIVVDLQSSNGSYLYGNKLQPNVQYPLQLNDKIYLLSDKSVCLEVLVGDDLLAISPNPHVNGNSIPSEEAGLLSLLQQKKELIIGRSSECDIVLNDLSISRKHAKVFMKSNQVYVEDLNSSNGVYINNKRIHRSQQLKEQDTLYIGLNAFKLGEKGVDMSKEHAISAENIEKVFSNGYKGLQTTTLQIPYKQMVALMGPSGCGKSTLLKALNGDSPPTQGSIKIFGLDMSEHFEMLKHTIGYVPQENIVHEDLTVEQSLYYAAKLRLSEDTSEAQIKLRITEVLESLKINTNIIRGTKVAKLSGGQKKRISIAVELLNKPKILFLDEPTSPLDPETIEEFLLCLKNLCKEGTTVIMVTHKPDDLNYVDRVIFMGVQGHLAYDGSIDGLVSHFKKDKLIGLYSMLSDSEASKNWYQQWRSKQAGTGSTAKGVISKKLEVNYLRQTYWLSMRYLSIKLGNTKNLLIMLMQPILIALLIMLAFDGLFKISTHPIDNSEIQTPRLGILFLMAIAAVWFGVSNSAKEIVGEKEILKREFMFNMKLINYLGSKLLVLTLISALQILILQTLLFLRFNDLAQFPMTWLWLMFISVCSIQFGLLLSSFSSSTEEVMSVLPIALMPQIILAGMIQPLENKITMFLSYFTLGRWGTEGLARIQDIPDEEKPFMTVLDGHLYSESVQPIFDTDGMMANAVAMGLLFVAMGIAVYAILMNKLNKGS